jgi:putative DNA-invertase from lambdoid prophage Rac
MKAAIYARVSTVGQTADNQLKHLVTLLDELSILGIAFVSLGEGIDCMTPAGKLQLHILAALAEFERERIRERVLAGLQRAKTQGKRLGRPVARIPVERVATVAGMSTREAAARLGVARSTLQRWRRLAEKTLQISV